MQPIRGSALWDHPAEHSRAPTRLSHPHAVMPSLEELVLHTKDLPVAPLEEWYAALHRHKEFGVQLSRFPDPSNPTQAGRVLVQFGAAVKKPAFQSESPTLCALYHAYRSNSDSFCVMITYRDALWMHCDLRALVSGLPYDGSYQGCLASKLAGPGPKEHIALHAHGLAGETSVIYGIVPACNNKKKTFRLPKKDPKLVPLQQTILRKAGERTRVETWVHAGCAGAKPRADGTLEVWQIPHDEQGTGRLLHAASGSGENGVSIAILASVRKKDEPKLCRELSDIKQKAQVLQQEVQALQQAEGATTTFLQWLSGAFRQQAAGFPTAAHGGTGGLTVEEQRDRSTLDQDASFIGRVTTNGDGTGTAHSSEAWKDRSTLDQDPSFIGRVTANGDGTFTAHSSEEWAKFMKDRAAENGTTLGGPVQDRTANCAKLDKLSRSSGWYTKTRPAPTERYPDSVATSYFHPVLHPKRGLSFKAAQAVALEAGEASATQPSIVAAMGESSSNPIVI